MEITYSQTQPSRYFIIYDGIYEISTNDLDFVVTIVASRNIEHLQLLDIQERKWIEVESLLKNNSKRHSCILKRYF